MGKVKTAVLSALLSGTALAAGTTANLTWTLPTEYVDGSPLSASDIKEVVILWRRPTSSAIVGSLHVPAPATSATATVVCNDYTFSAFVVLNDTSASAENGPIPYATGIKCIPNPPGTLTVN